MSANFARLRTDSVFYPLFHQGLVPIKNIIVPNVVNCEGGGGAQQVYMVDLGKLGDRQLEELIDLVRRQCSPEEPLESVRAEILNRGLPLRATQVVSVSTDVPFFL